MASENVEVVRRTVEPYNRADVAGVMALCSDDVVFLPARSAIHGEYRGEAGLRRFFADNAETFDVFTARFDEIHDAGDRVVAIGKARVRPLGGGPETEIPHATVFTLDAGKIVRVEDMRERAVALRAVGLL